MEKRDLSFIPKKVTTKLIYKKDVPIGLIFSIGLLIVSGLVLGGSYIYKRVIQGNINDLKESIEKAEIVPEESLMNELKNISKKIENTKILLARHKSLGPVFDILKESTLKSVRFLNFNYSISNDNMPQISMDGEAKSYSSLALQVGSFEENTRVESVSVSNLSLGESGKINFSIDIIINPDVLIYENQQ